MMDPGLGYLIAVAIALLYGHAALHKWRSPARFTATIDAYRLVPRAMSPLLGILVPLLETSIAGGLLIGVTRPYAAAGGAVVLLVYAVAIGINLQRGRVDLDCGCTGPAERRPIAAWMIGRNAMLAGILATVAAPWAPRPLTAIDGVTIVGGLVTCLLVYTAVDRLLGQVMPRTAALRRGL